MPSLLMSTRVATMPSPFGAAALISAAESCGKLSWFSGELLVLPGGRVDEAARERPHEELLALHAS
eukprot:2040277-Heterocapsa_arctica.AAC.1